jgi:uncharacterized coiled-coil protein SlyX
MIRMMLFVGLMLGAHGALQAQTVEELKRAIAERDAVIRELQQRINVLQRRAAPVAAQVAPATAAPDDEELTRALERTLVQQGGLLLRAGAWELQPEASYAHWDRSRGPLRRLAGSALSARVGLPWESQFQLRVPYQRVVSANGSRTALGDVELSLAKQFLREAPGRAGLIASLGWVARTGKDGFDGGTPTGAGFNVLQAGLTAVKRSDPLMLYGGISYAAPLSRRISGDDVAPGNTLGLRLGTILAASPETALNFGLNLGFARPTQLNGQAVADSDAVLGTLQLGVATILTRNLLLNVTGDIRIAGNAPNFRLTVSLPFRF